MSKVASASSLRFRNTASWKLTPQNTGDFRPTASCDRNTMHATEFLRTPPDALPCVIALIGDERALKDSAIATLTTAALNENDDAPSRFTGKNADMKTVRDELLTISMWSDRRVVIIDEASDFVSANRAALEKYVEAPAKKSPAKKTPAKKAPAKKTSSVTTPTRTSVASSPRVSADVTRPKAPVAVAGTASASVQLAVREDEDPWTEAELAVIREQLSEELDNLSLELAAMRSELDELMSEVADAAGDDQADTGSKTYEREHEMSLMASVTDMREQVQHALTMVDSGEYGRCESCENPIGKVRLQAFPRATLCLSCKQRQERR